MNPLLTGYSHSAFIDIALATPMKESKTRIIDLPDITSKEWSLMMKFLDWPPPNPLETSLSGLVSVAKKFDEYEFTNGLTACALEISKIYARLRMILDSPPENRSPDMSHFIASQIQLKKSMPAILGFLC